MLRRLTALTLLSALTLGCPGSRAKPPAPPIAEPPAPADDGGATGDRPHYTEFAIEDNHLVLPGPIVFTGAGDLDVEASAAALWFIHDYLVAKDYITLVRIEGHSDQDGDEELMATGQRALDVGNWLVSQGIACDRLMAAAFGNLKPIADGSTAEGQAKNRRIEVANAMLRGIAIGGMPVDGSAPASAPVCD